MSEPKKVQFLFKGLPILSVRFYRTDNGNEPVRAFFKQLRLEDRKTLGTDIKTVQFCWPLGMPLVRKMAPSLWEARSRIADGIVRVFFTVAGSDMVLLHAFVKKSAQTPKTELETARIRLQKIAGKSS